MSELTVTFLGTAASSPTERRGVSAVALRHEGDTILFDCGEGTQRQMLRYYGLKPPTAIFVTHGHTDHWLGLPGLLKTIEGTGYEERIRVYLPKTDIHRISTAVNCMGGWPSFVEVLPVEADQHFFYEKFTVSAFDTNHCHGSVGYCFSEPFRNGKFDPQKAIERGVQPGPDFRRLQNGETVNGVRPSDVIGPPRPGRSVVYTGDTRPMPDVPSDGVDIVIHEATFSSENQARAKSTGHSTGAEAGFTAKKWGAKTLYLTHFSSRERARDILREAEQSFGGVVVAAYDGMQVNLPLSD